MPKIDRALLAAYLQPEWRRSALLGLLLFTSIGLQLANPLIVKSFIDHAHGRASLHPLIWIALLFLGVAILTQVATVVETYVAEDLGWRTTNALRSDLTRHVLRLDAAFHAQHSPGELIERIDGDVSAIADFFARFVVQILGNAVLLVGVLVLLYAADWRVGLLLTMCAVGALFFMSRGGNFVTVRAGAARQAAADLSGYVEERLSGITDLKSSGADAHAMQGLHRQLTTRFQRVVSMAMAGSLFNGTVGIIFALGTGGALAVSVGLYQAGAISLGTIYVVFRYTGMLRLPLERLSVQMNSLAQATGGIVRVRNLLETEVQITDGPGATFPDGALSVEFDAVSFAYHAAPILNAVSFGIEPGEVLGLLGRTGSGKTTISRLLFRLQDPTAGVIRLGGVDLRAAQVDSMRGRVGLVTQDVQLFRGTVRDNITLFNPGVSDNQLHDTLKHLGLAIWLDALPSGLDTGLGVGGRGVSAGEAQLIALARVFLKDPGLVVLDEASSRVDPTTRSLLESGMSHLLEGRTGVIIAHRLETVERADVILILEGGRVAEFGRRADLIRDERSRFSKLRAAGMVEELA